MKYVLLAIGLISASAAAEQEPSAPATTTDYREVLGRAADAYYEGTFTVEIPVPEKLKDLIKKDKVTCTGKVGVYLTPKSKQKFVVEKGEVETVSYRHLIKINDQDLADNPLCKAVNYFSPIHEDLCSPEKHQKDPKQFFERMESPVDNHEKVVVRTIFLPTKANGGKEFKDIETEGSAAFISAPSCRFNWKKGKWEKRRNNVHINTLTLNGKTLTFGINTEFEIPTGKLGEVFKRFGKSIVIKPSVVYAMEKQETPPKSWKEFESTEVPPSDPPRSQGSEKSRLHR